MATWYDLKLAVLQKMFSADDRIIADESTLGYLAAMPHCANEGLALLATAGKFVTKSVKIAQMDIPNLVDPTIADKIHQVEGMSEPLVVETDRGQAVYFEACGKGEIEIQLDGDPIRNIRWDTTGYETYRVRFENCEIDQETDVITERKVTLIFWTTSQFGACAVKNIAIYRAQFESDEEVPAYTDKIKYDLKEIAPDFFMIDPQGVYYEGAYQTYLQTSEFYQEGTHTLVLDRDMIGAFTIYYRAYPVQITKSTEDTYELPLDPEVYALLPLYMASQLYKDDDNGIATSYRNEFEVGFERLINSANLSAYEEWTSESGWV